MYGSLFESFEMDKVNVLCATDDNYASLCGIMFFNLAYWRLHYVVDDYMDIPNAWSL